MKKIIKTIMVVVAVVISLTACAQKSVEQAKGDDMKSLIIYFTHSGNTELAAKDLQKVTNSDIVRLYPEKAYSSEDVDWVNEQSRCTQEHLNQTLRPAIKPLGVNIADYDTIYIGFPIWWHEEPAVIRTLLDTLDFRGKELYPFCTSYESPMSEADATLQKGFPSLKWHTGLRFPASTEQIKEWIGK
ncbi:MAG: flavodoxin [Muribaculum sp.]|nr:flavodoxin [Muribaculum sp.]